MDNEQQPQEGHEQSEEQVAEESSRQPAELADTRASKKAGFYAGALAGLLFTMLLIAFRFMFNTQSLTEVMADWFTALLPAPIFDFFLENLLFNAKRLLFGMIFIGQIGVGGLIGVAYARKIASSAEKDGSGGRGFLMGGAIFLTLAGVVTPVVGGGFFGTDIPGGGYAYSIPLLLASPVFGLTLTQILALTATKANEAYNASRRDFLRKAAVVTTIALVGGFAIQSIVANIGQLTPAISGRRRGELASAITPNDEFYVVAKSAVTPQVDVDSWRLELSGDQFSNPMEITYEQLLDMPAIEEYVTLTCISNPIGGDLISNALWKGVPLKILLEQAGISPDAERMAFYAADGYYDSFPIDWAMRDEVIVAYEMNGEPLPPSHGFPARIIVPGLYGMENVKWLVRATPVESSFRGYWQKRGWADTAVIKTSSRIDMPEDRSHVPVNLVEVAGVAFAGTRSISRVEVSLDDGATWRDADFDQPLSDMTWVIWHLDWESPMPGTPVLKVRATDGEGNVEVQERTDAHPSGATGYHTVHVTITEPATPTPTPASA